MRCELVVIKLFVGPPHDLFVHAVLYLEHGGGDVLQLLHCTRKESVGEEGVDVALYRWR
jgi:hypothetical protein